MVESPQRSRSRIMIFTDLDGTLLDDQTFEYQPALPALTRIHLHKIPLVLASSKTRAEIEPYWKRLSPESPFVVENGGAIFFPPTFPLPEDYRYERVDEYKVVFIGRPLKEIHERIRALKRQIPFKVFSEIPAEEIAALTGLTLGQAILASKREFDEPIVLQRPLDDEGLFFKKASEVGLDCVYGGRFFHLFLGGEKGKAIEKVLHIYRALRGPVFSIGLGDSPNDISMLKIMDRAVLMQARDGGYIKGFEHRDLIRVEEGGPKAWNRVVLDILADFSP